MSEDEDFPKSSLASAVASKCYYHLEEYDDALRLALGSGDLFDVNANDLYVDTMISKCIDSYIEKRLRLRSQSQNAKEEEEESGNGGRDQNADRNKDEIDPRMENIVEQMFARCFSEGNKLPVGEKGKEYEVKVIMG